MKKVYTQFTKKLNEWDKSISLIKNSSFNTHKLNEWTEARSFISDVIHKDGTILDIGCANGFFLKCMKEWSKYNLNPYGMDIHKTSIERAKKLFPDISDHFIKESLSEIDKINKDSFPHKFDFIYWNVWTHSKIEKDKESILINFSNVFQGNKIKGRIDLKKILNKVKKKGRLIFGFYDSKQENIRKIKKLKRLGYKFSKVIENPCGRPEVIAYVDK